MFCLSDICYSGVYLEEIVKTQWANLGNRIIISTNQNNNYKIVIFDESGKQINEIQIKNKMKEFAVSPDGKKIIYSTNGKGTWLINTEKTNEMQIDNNNGTNFQWSPDSKRVVFTIIENLDNKIYINCYLVSEDEKNKKKIYSIQLTP